MKIKRNELDAIKAVLDDDTFETDEDMAKALIHAMEAELARRETYVLVERDGGLTFLWPFWYAKDAQLFHERHPPLSGAQARVYKMRSPWVDDQLLIKHDEEARKRTEGLNWPTVTPTEGEGQ